MTMKEREFQILEAVAENEYITQANLAVQLGCAVGSVNWYIKRLISRGYLKVTRMDKTRLRYNLTVEGMNELTRRAALYMKDSLKVYRKLREEAKQVVEDLKRKNIRQIYLEGKDEVMDIMRLTCIEAGIGFDAGLASSKIRSSGKEFKLIELSKLGMGVGDE